MQQHVPPLGLQAAPAAPSAQNQSAVPLAPWDGHPAGISLPPAASQRQFFVLQTGLCARRASGSAVWANGRLQHLNADTG